jgi:mannose-6-phosphate isomerase-like protein (cupin superfamily)
MRTLGDQSFYLLDGIRDMTIDDTFLMLNEGQSYFSPRNIRHRVDSPPVPRRLFILIALPRSHPFEQIPAFISVGVSIYEHVCAFKSH